MSIMPAPYSPSQKGFGLIEVLVTVVILGIGLLGLAGLQVQSLSYNHSAYNRSQATLLAYDIIDRMRANPAAIASYVSGTPTVDANCMTITGCNATSMALNDLAEWNAAINVALPAATSAISVNNNIYTINLTWDEDRDGNAANNPSFNVSFQP